MSMKTRYRTALLVLLAGVGPLASAEDRPYAEGNVVQVAGIRTEYGRFDDYLKFLDTTYKQMMEAQKKAGLIVSYQVMQVEPRTADDPDIYLVTTFKNWAALDGIGPKMDAIEGQVYGSLVKSNSAAVERSKIRRNLGSQTMQILNLK